METDHLRWFCQVAQSQNLTKTAESLHITPPTLSRAIGNLEQELDRKLFDRVSGRLRLNDAGQVFYENAREALERLDSGIALLDGMKEDSGEPVVLSNSGVVRDALACLYSASVPSLRVVTRKYDAGASLAFLSGGQAQLCVLRCCPGEERGEWETLLEERLFLLTGSGQPAFSALGGRAPIAALEGLSLSMDEEHKDAGRWLLSLYRRSAAAPRIAYEPMGNIRYVEQLLSTRPLGLLVFSYDLLTEFRASVRSRRLRQTLVDDPRCAFRICLAHGGRRAIPALAAATRAHFAQLQPEAAALLEE